MSGKKRFGISVPAHMAEQLDRLAEKLGTDRSRLVVEALETFLHDNLHVLEPHKCSGIIVSRSTRRSLGDIVEKYRDIIISYNHYHVDGQCIVTMIVSGDSERIVELSGELCRLGCRVRYIPFSRLA